ncbi:MAG: hypothetical protein ACYC69_12015 [Thermodesulfovibrionales bacterium]
MEITVTLNDKEMRFLQKIADELSALQRKENTLQDALHECIRMALYDESEEQ